MSRYPKRFLNPRRLGSGVRGRRSRRRRVAPARRSDGSQRPLVPDAAQPMIFGGAVETPEHHAERQRRRRLARLLKKHGLDERRGPLGWRI